MKIIEFGDKAKQSVINCGFLTVWEGSVRSMKTVTSLWGWLNYVISSPEKVFLMSGNSLGSLTRNCVDGDFGLIALSCGAAVKRRDESGWFLDILNKKIYLTGAGNKASYKSITGLTIGGWYADEINLHDRQAVIEFFNRSIASTDRKNYWTLNPEPPGHWIYRDFIDKYLEEKTPGFRWFHFTLDDNPAISEERKKELIAQYTGVFYQRYILGLRVRAEGACYPSFSQSCIVKEIPGKILYINIGSDIGGTASATAYAADGFFIHEKTGKLCLVLWDEFYDIENKDTETIVKNFGVFVKKQKEEYTVHDAYSDSAEQLIKRSFNNLGIVRVHDSKKNPIVDRIRFIDSLMGQGRFFIMERCRHTIDGLHGAVWDSKAEKETRLDDGTSNIDSLDALEYGCEMRMKDFR